MKADIWSPHFQIGWDSGYLEKSNVDIPDNLKIGDEICMFNKYVCKVEDIYISYGRVNVKLKVIRIQKYETV